MSNFLKNPFVHGVLVFVVMFLPSVIGLIPKDFTSMTLGGLAAMVLLWLQRFVEPTV